VKAKNELDRERGPKAPGAIENIIVQIMTLAPDRFRTNVEERLKKVITALISDPPTDPRTVWCPYEINPILVVSGDPGEHPRRIPVHQKPQLRERYRKLLETMSSEEIAALIAIRYLLGLLMPHFVRRRAEAVGVSLTRQNWDIGGAYWYGLDCGGSLSTTLLGPSHVIIEGVPSDNLSAKLSFLLTQTPFKVTYCDSLREEKQYLGAN